MQHFRRAESPILLPQRKRLHDIQHFQCCEALHVGGQLVNRPIAVRRRDGLHEFARKLGQVLRGHRPVVPLHRFQNLRGDFAFVKCFSAMLCYPLERPREIRIAKYLAYFRWAVSRKISLRCRFIGPPTPITAFAAIAASTAFPPRSRMRTPASAANGDSAATIPFREITIDRPCERSCASTFCPAVKITMERYRNTRNIEEIFMVRNRVY